MLKRVLFSAAGLSMVFAIGIHSASAALVNFTVADFDDVNQVLTSGVLIEAHNLGSGSDGDDVASNAGNPGNVTMNGVTFVGDPGDGVTDIFFVDAATTDFRRPNYKNPNDAAAAVTGLSDADGNALFHSYERNQANGRGRLTGLTPGQAYVVQLFLDRNNGGSVHDFGYSLTAGGVAVYPIEDASALRPIVVTGTFIADGTTQDIFVEESGTFVGELAAFQLRTPEPTSLALLGLGGLMVLRRRR